MPKKYFGFETRDQLDTFREYINGLKGVTGYENVTLASGNPGQKASYGATVSYEENAKGKVANIIGGLAELATFGRIELNSLELSVKQELGYIAEYVKERAGKNPVLA